VAKPNYAFAKRQRDLAKKAKKEEKRMKKAGASGAPSEEAQALPSSGDGKTVP
jgi:hypothetical protein